MVGRPAFKPTDAQKNDVERLIAAGLSRDACARALRISVPTLAKAFRKSIEMGAAQRRAATIDLLFARAHAGNVAAIVALEKMGRVAR